MSFRSELEKIPEALPAWELRIQLASARDMARFDIATFWWLCPILVAAAAVLGVVSAQSFYRARAVEAGAAHWEVSTHGEPSFHWNDEEAGK